MKITVLVDNIEANNCSAEWGLSFLIEYNSHKFLLDMGASDIFTKNAEKMGIDLKEVDYAVLSHAHFDHSDGIDSFFNINDKAPLYIQQSAEENCYKKVLFLNKYIGIKKGVLKEYKNRLIKVDGMSSIIDGVKIFGHTTNGLDNIGLKEHMYLKKEHGWVPDNFSHEQSLVFELKDGIIIFNSCSHGGFINIVSEIKAKYPDSKILAYFGGLHLYSKTKDEVRRIAGDINESGINKVFTGHCTGDKAFVVLQDELSNKVEQFKCGCTYSFDE